MQINLYNQWKVVTATFNISQAATNFIALLPLTLTLKNFGSNEKVSGLSQKLSTAGSVLRYTP